MSERVRPETKTVTALPPHLVDAVRAITRPGMRVLDLGSGTCVHQPLVEQEGATYVGVDIRPGATLRADAHALPFADCAFDAIVSTAVLEHLRNPFVATEEAFRVLRPGGRFFGVVAFLEPFHDSSYCHLSHLGTRSVLESAGFSVERMWPGASILRAFSDDLFGGLPVPARRGAAALGWAADALRLAALRSYSALARSLGRRGPNLEHLSYVVAGSIGFIAKKLPDHPAPLEES